MIYIYNIYIYIFHLTFFINSIHIFIVIIYYCVKNIDPLCCVYKKTNSFLSFCSPIFLWKIHKCRGMFFETRGEGNSLKRMYDEDGT